MADTEKQFESDIESYLISKEGGWEKAADSGYRSIESKGMALDIGTLVKFVQDTQKLAWVQFEKRCNSDPKRKFYKAFEDAVASDGMVSVLRHGFKYRGQEFKVCYFKPESELNQLSNTRYRQNVCQCIRQWHYSEHNNNSVDMLLAINGIPLIAIELKNQLTGQNVDNAMNQWMHDRDSNEPAFQFNHRILAYFAVDLYSAAMATKLEGGKTYFLPFNQGSAGAGNDGGAGNPPAEDGSYVTSYIWKNVFQKDKLMDILQKFISLQKGKTKKNDKIIFPRYHQLDVVRKLIQNVYDNGPGRNYLIQHSAGSGKSNSIAWTAYRLASMHRNNKPVYNSVVIVTDRRVLDSQLQETIGSFDHTLGSVVLIDYKKSSKDLLQAINDGKRIIVTTLQKFPIIFDLVGDAGGKSYAVIVDEAHSSQTGQSALKLKMALADTQDALKEYAEMEGLAEDEIDLKNDKFLQELVSAGRHKNLSFFAFTATPKDKTLEIFGDEHNDGSFHPFHIYSMKQAIEEGFIMDVLSNYTTYKTCYNLAKANEEDQEEVPASQASKAIRRFAIEHPYNIAQKSQVIVDTFESVTSQSVKGKGKMMVVTESRLAAVRYFKEVRRLATMKNPNILVMIAFSGSLKDPSEDSGVEYTESSLNVDKDGNHVTEGQTKAVFHDQGSILIVAEKYQTGFDEPLLHTMIIDKKLRDVKAVQTISRLNRIHPDKDDTFVIDFVNTKEEILGAFQPFYTETSLEAEINIDLIYKTQMELREFKVYGDEDVERIHNIKFNASGGKKADAVQGQVTNALLGVSNAYNELEQQQRYQFRRKVRCFVKWYNYITTIIRLFNIGGLHDEYIFCSYLIHLIPPEPKKDWSLDDRVRLEYYKLQHTYTGSIELDKNVSGQYEPAKVKSSGTMEQKKETLDEVLERINEALGGDFTEGDRVIMKNLWDKLSRDKALNKSAKQDGRQMFENNIFPKRFEEVAMESYMESQETYESLFSDIDKKKYTMFMSMLASELFELFTKK